MTSFFRRLWAAAPITFWMVLAALAIRLAVVPFVYDEWTQPYFIGHWEQGNVARALLAGHGFGSSLPSSQPSAIMTPVFPLIVAGIFAVFGIHTTASILATLSLNCLFSALACIPVFGMTRRSFGSRSALWAGWAWAFSPYGIYFSAEWAWSTHLLLLCLCWLLYLSQDLERSPRLLLWAGFGVLGGFAGLTEPVILPIAGFLIAIACWQRFRLAERWLLPGLIACLAMLATLTPWTVRNAMVFHKFIPMRNGLGMEMLIGNSGNSKHWVNCDYCPMHSERELAEYNNVGEVAFMQHKMQQAMSIIHANPKWYATMCFRRALYSWTGYWSFDKDYLAGESMDPYNIPVATFLSLMAFVGLYLAWRRKPFEALRYGGVLLLYPLLYYFVNPGAYRMRPIDPVIALLGCFAIVTLKERERVSESIEPQLIPEEEEELVTA